MKRLTSLLLLVLLVCVSASAQNQAWIEASVSAKAQLREQMLKAGMPVASKLLTSKDQAQHFVVDVKGMDKLALITTDANNGNVSDHTVWANGRFITESGETVWLDELKYEYGTSQEGAIRINANFRKKPIKIRGKAFKHGVTCHANGILVYDVDDKFVRFEAEVGIDDMSPFGSVYFKAANVSTKDAVAKLNSAFPKEMSQLLLAFPNFDVWLTDVDGSCEKGAALMAIAKLNDKAYFTAELNKIEASQSELDVKLAAYLQLIADVQSVVTLQQELEWVNLPATEKAFNNMKTLKGFDVATNQARLNELKSLMSKGFKGMYSFQPAGIADAKRALELKKQIVFANPLLDVDKIVVSRFRLGNKDRRALGPEIGTQNNNWSNQESSRRGGFDADIVELTNLRGEMKTRSVFKAPYSSPISDLKMHWDADRVMFTALDSDKRWNIWEVKLDGTGHRKLVPIPEKDLEFYDGTYLPDGRVIAISNIGYQGVPCVSGKNPVGNMVLYNPEDESYRRITFDQDANWNPTVMHNGKVMYTRWEYTDLMHYYSRFVMYMNPDGTEQKALFGSGSAFPNATYDMQPLPGHSTAFASIVSGHHGVARSGRMFLFDPAKSRKGVEGIMNEILHSDGNIDTKATDSLVNNVWPKFLKPMPLNDTYFLVAAKMSPTDLWGIYLVDTFDNMTCVIKEESYGFISPILVKKQVTPPVIPDRVKLDQKEATVFIQDIYEGEGLRGVPRGTIKELRLHSYEYAYLYTKSDHNWHGVQSGWDIKRKLGTVPVEEDGSVIFTVPANTPISIQPIDENGASVQWMRSWLTAQPGEVVSCVGCHEDLNEIPVPKRVIASQRPPHAIKAPEGGVRSFTYDLEIQPILDRACISCHDGDKAFNLTKHGEVTVGETSYGKSYLNLHPYVHRQGPEADMAVLQPYEYHANTSELIRILKNGHANVKLTDQEWRTLYNWIDYNAPYLGRFNANYLEMIPYDKNVSQIDRRKELADKYACEMGVDWRQELEDYADYLEAQGPITPVMPEAAKPIKSKNVKVKSWPFDAAAAAQLQAATGQTTKEIELAPGVKIKFVRIPAGEFAMGANKGVANHRPLSKVKIEKDFWMAEVEITNEQYAVLCPEHDSRYVDQLWKDHVTDGYPANLPEQPVIRVSYLDAMNYCKLLSEKTGLNITLPTEAQWEWACRAGSATDFWYGNLNSDFGRKENLADKACLKMAVIGVDPKPMSTSNAWYDLYTYLPKDASVDDGAMNQVDSKNYEANPFGLYSMHGNIAEWTRSDFASYPYKAEPKEASQYKVVRGGSYIERPKFSTSFSRKAFYPHQRVFNVGFRVIIED